MGLFLEMQSAKSQVKVSTCVTLRRENWSLLGYHQARVPLPLVPCQRIPLPSPLSMINFIIFLFKVKKLRVERLRFNSEISCIDKMQCGDRNICAVGLWSTKVLLVELGSEMKISHTKIYLLM